MEKTYFDIRETNFEIRIDKPQRDAPAYSADEIFDTVYSAGYDFHLVSRFASLEEAQAAFSKERRLACTNIVDAYSSRGSLLMGRVYCLEENTFFVDEDGEEDFDQGSVVDFAAESFPGGLDWQEAHA